jgi:sugar/nucleoside kinase (ribokinase family)
VDILFANEEEALSLFEVRSIERAIEAHQGKCDVTVITRSAKGSLVLTDHEVLEVPAEPVEHVVDTTGAGDLFASGFLYGLATGRDLATCGRLGGVVAAEIIGHFGARPETDLKQLVAPLLDPRATR